MSVVIPVRDQAPRLRLTLAALEKQEGISPDDYEVIVVNDDSRDNLATVLAEMIRDTPYDLRVLKCFSGGCRGVPRNLGAHAALGEIIVFLDADACPSRRLVTEHVRAQSSSGERFVLGDFYVIQRTERLLDPANGTPFPQFESSSYRSHSSWCIPIDRIRDLGDAALTPDAEKGGYPGMRQWQLQLEELLTTGNVSFAWAGVVPHNLSVRRDAFQRLGGFNSSLRHAEGWDLGIRAQNAGCMITCAHGARSFHLHHWRSTRTYSGNVRDALGDLRARYPDAGLEAVILWTESLSGNEYVPPELNFNNWRVVARRLGTADGRAAIRDLYGRFLSTKAPDSVMDYLTGSALNSPRALAPSGHAEDEPRD